MIITVVVVAILAIGAFLLVNNKNKSTSSTTSSTTSSDNSSSNNSSGDSSNSSSTPASDTVTITYTDSGFSPNSATVKNGGKIIWVNKSGSQVQIGVNPHPTHTGDRMITNGQFTLDLNDGAQTTVSVTKTGTFGYHNHLLPNDTGTITVE
ncbi:MAG TPA: cupredoxin domain-containing protein [Candidatus Saccharimonadales bacterium]|nr:cupredoxin domain-containing protein [Candidatus Saccharimonadales bacterium]